MYTQLRSWLVYHLILPTPIALAFQCCAIFSSIRLSNPSWCTASFGRTTPLPLSSSDQSSNYQAVPARRVSSNSFAKGAFTYLPHNHFDYIVCRKASRTFEGENTVDDLSPYCGSDCWSSLKLQLVAIWRRRRLNQDVKWCTSLY
jgi:hypothetical protein